MSTGVSLVVKVWDNSMVVKKIKMKGFIKLSTLAGLGFALPSISIFSAFTDLQHCAKLKTVYNLLKGWRNGIIRYQIISLSNLKEHGLLQHPACKVIHPRCVEYIYLFLYMVEVTGYKKYLNAGMAALGCGEIVSCPD